MLALALPVLIVMMLGVLLVNAVPALRRFGPSFLWTSTWDPIAEVYGAAPMIFGTLASSLLALLIAVPLALSVAIFLTEFSPRWLRQPVAFLVELLAAIPSVVYGMWGIFVLIPFLRSYVVPPLKAVFGRPERVVAQPVHQRDDGFGFVKHGGEMLVRQPPFIDRCALQTNVFQVNVPRI